MTFDFRMPPTEFTRPAGMRRGWPHVEIGPQPSATLERVLARLRTLPGVCRRPASRTIQRTRSCSRGRVLTVEGRAESGDGEGTPPVYFLVTPDFFSTMRTPIVRGREFGPRRHRLVTVGCGRERDAGAERYWPGEDAIGKLIRLDVSSDEPAREIVGSCATFPPGGHRSSPNPWFTRPRGNSRQRRGPACAGMFGRMTFVLRTAGDPASLVAAVQRAVAEVEPDRPLANISTRRVEPYFFGRYAYVFVLVAFALAATLIASIGVYGVMSYAVAQRLREIAIRIALGADGRAVFAAVARQALAIIGVGVGLGFLGALAMGRLISSQLWGVSPTDPRRSWQWRCCSVASPPPRASRRCAAPCARIPCRC